MRIRRGVVIAALASLVATGAMAKPSTKERVTALEAQVAELAAAAEAAKVSAEQVVQLEREVRRLTGEVEELTYQLDQANARIYSLSTAVAGEEGGAPLDDATRPMASGPGAIAAPAAGGPTNLLSSGGRAAPGVGAPADAPPTDVALPLDPDAAFNYANGFLFSEDWPRAEAAFSLFVAAYGDHPRAADAQFRLGEIYLARDKYAEAADAFVTYIRQYPDEMRVADAYLKLGASFAGLGETAEACKVLSAVKSKYPDADPRLIDRANAEMRRNNCG
ncbi:MAG: tetratricopeptide repeat protein [Pseudomonadota bacterium]